MRIEIGDKRLRSRTRPGLANRYQNARSHQLEESLCESTRRGYETPGRKTCRNNPPSGATFRETRQRNTGNRKTECKSDAGQQAQLGVGKIEVFFNWLQQD